MGPAQTLKRKLKSSKIWLSLLASMAAVANADPDQERRFDCLIEPLRVIQVGSPVQGIVESVAVDRSDVIQEGQVLAQLESAVEQASLEQARARALMDGEIQSKVADLALARQIKARVDELYTRSMASSQQKDEADAKVQVAQMALRQAKERKSLAEYEYVWASKVLERRTIRSPISGVVAELRAQPGEFVYENPIMAIAQIDPLRVEVILPVELFGSLQPGMRGVVYPEVGSEVAYAEITIIDRLIDPGSSTFGARLELSNSKLAIPGGQRCEVAFVGTDNSSDERLAAVPGAPPGES